MKFLRRRIVLYLIAPATLFTRAFAQDEFRPPKPLPPPEPWQAAGIRAAFGDSRAPICETSPAVQREALKISAQYGWGAALDAQEVTAYLGSHDRSLQIAAFRALGQMGKAGGRFAKEVAAFLQDRETRNVAIDTLGRMGVAGAAYSREVAALIDQDHLSVDEALGQMGSDGAPVGKDVAPYLKSEIRVVRISAASALGKMGKEGANYAPQVAELLRDDNEFVRQAAMTALGEMGDSGAAFAPQVAAAMRDRFSEDSAVAKAALIKMSAGNNGSIVAARAAAGLLEDANPEVRAFAAEILAEMGRPGTDFAGKIALMLADHDPGVRSSAAESLGKMGKAGGAFAERVAGLLPDENPDVRSSAAEALGYLGEDGEKFASLLLPLLKDQNAGVRIAATDALIGMETAGAAFASSVAALLQDQDDDVRAMAALALFEMADGRLFTRDVIDLLWEEKTLTYEKATLALVGMAKRGRPIAGQIVPFLREAKSKMASPRTLPAAGEVIAFARKEKQDATPAICALGAIGEEAGAYVKDVAEFLQDESTREAAVRALGQMGENGAAFAGQIAPLLSDMTADDSTRIAVVEALGRMGSNGARYSKNVIESLRGLKGAGKERLLERTAAEALDAMRKAGAKVSEDAIVLLYDAQIYTRAIGTDLLDRCGNPSGDWDLEAAMLAAVDAAPTQEVPALRAHLRVWTGANPALQRAVTWLGRPDLEPMPKAGISEDEACQVLSVFAALWDPAVRSVALRDELDKRIAQISTALHARAGSKTADILGALKKKLQNSSRSRRGL